MSRSVNNLSIDAQVHTIDTPATRNEAIPTLLEFLQANGSKWCRISIKPNKAFISFRANKIYYFGEGTNLFQAYDALQQRVNQA